MDLKSVLEDVKNGNIDIDGAYKLLKDLSFEELGYAKIDHHRKTRKGIPETVYCPSKTSKQIIEILKHMLQKGNKNIVATRADENTFLAVAQEIPNIEYNEAAGIMILNKELPKHKNGTVAVVTAGTADISVAEEAAVFCEVSGCETIRIFDVGVAGIHRLFAKLDEIKKADVIIAVAGMEGALPSVLAGLVDVPVIAVPTSVGYGANFGGISALLTMLNSCAEGIGVVNIDNGFGAACLAVLIARQKDK